MKTLTTIASVLLLLFAANMSHAQESGKNKKISVYGNVYDSFTKAYLNAHVTLMRSDSTVIDTTACEKPKHSVMSYYEFSLPLTGQFRANDTRQRQLYREGDSRGLPHCKRHVQTGTERTERLF